MGKYIKTFDTHDEYETYIGGVEAMLPNVSYCKNINDVHYNPIVVGINTYISCVDIASGEELAGSHIQVLDQDGEVVEEWTSTTEVHEVEGLNKGTTYTLRTTVAPNGYVLATAITFTIDGTGQITYSGNTTTDEDGNTVLLVELQRTILKVSCVNIADGEGVEGSTIQVIDSEENVVEEWTSTVEVHTIEGLNVNEEYTLKTTVASEGFILPTDATFSINETGHVTSTGSTTTDEYGNTVLLVEMQITILKVSCTDIGSGEELEGSVIQILDQDGVEVEEWTSTTEPHTIEGLKTGETYTLRTTVAPDGYLPTSDTTFSIDETGEVTSTGNTTIDEEGNTVLLVEVQMTQVQVLCVDVANGEELEGSTIQIIDSEGNVVEEWISTNAAHEIEGLNANEEYTLSNTVASDGYVLATDTTFTIDETGEVTSTGTISEEGILLVELQMTQVQVLCVDVANGDELEGSHIQVIDQDGRVVEEWDSTGEAHQIEGLKTGETYTLRNTVASDGYKVASDTTFTIDETGEVTSTGTISEEGILFVEMEKTQIQVSCTDIGSGEELEGSHIQVIDSEGTVVEEWDSTGEAHQIEGLKTGETYTLRTTVASEGFILPTDTTFTINDEGRVTSTGAITEDGILLVELAKTIVNISCVDIANGTEVEGATIQVIDSEGNMVEEWTSTTEPHTIEGLKTGETYKLRTTIVPDEYLPTTETTFSIDETGRVTGTGTMAEDNILLVELRHK